MDVFVTPIVLSLTFSPDISSTAFLDFYVWKLSLSRYMRIAALLLCLLGSDCAGLSNSPPDLAERLRALNPDEETLSRKTHVIDIHTHTFNARDLPIEHLLFARRDITNLTEKFSDRSLKFIAAALLYFTPAEPDLVSKGDENSKNPLNINLVELTNSWEFKAVANALELDRIQRSRGNRSKEQLQLQERIIRSPEQVQVLGLLGGVFGTHQDETTAEQRTLSARSLSGIATFVGDLTSSNRELLKRFRNQNGDRINFRVSHMMDMAPTYDQQEGKEGLRRFYPREVDIMADLQKRDKGNMCYFVAYSPYRDHWGANNHAGYALEAVRKAIDQSHAYGVKIYPPAGYRPISNSIPAEPTQTFTGPVQQYNARYFKNGTKITNEDFDQRLLDLLSWCVAEDIPVFAHCYSSEVQALGGYAKIMADAHWWRKLLESHPNLAKLRLCLAHAGGPLHWFGTKEESDWGADVYHLCTHYENVYCEMGDLDDIMTEARQVHFARLMIDVCNNDPNAPTPFQFKTKIMYGSDWYMPISADRHEFLKKYQQVFLLAELQQHYKSFFLGNALQYLDARNRITNSKHPLEGSVKTRLLELLNETKR